LLPYADLVACLWQSLVAAIVTSHPPVLPTLTAALVTSFPNQPLLVAVELHLSCLLPLDVDCCVVGTQVASGSAHNRLFVEWTFGNELTKSTHKPPPTACSDQIRWNKVKEKTKTKKIMGRNEN
jgi:hypothetical protein